MRFVQIQNGTEGNSAAGRAQSHKRTRGRDRPGARKRAAGGRGDPAQRHRLPGPGSWKREAYWDEYVVTVANRGTGPLTIESATLTDFQGRVAKLSDNPWTLEKESRTYAERVARTAGDVFKIGGGAVVTTSALFVAGAATPRVARSRRFG